VTPPEPGPSGTWRILARGGFRQAGRARGAVPDGGPSAARDAHVETDDSGWRLRIRLDPPPRRARS
jgi:hypothetical protein